MNESEELKEFEVTAYVQVEVKTLVRASTPEEAEQIASSREVSICAHGCWMVDESESEFVLSETGSVESINEIEER
jgi:hypothetical protein